MINIFLSDINICCKNICIGWAIINLNYYPDQSNKIIIIIIILSLLLGHAQNDLRTPPEMTVALE